MNATPSSRSWICGLSLSWAVCAALPLFPLSIAAQQGPSKEYQLKAVFIFNFAQFVSWPTNAFTNTNAPIIIGVLGNNPFNDYLDQIVHGEKVQGRPLEMHYYRTVDEITRCHVLFISRSEAARLDEIVAKLRGRSTLTVADVEGFTDRGGMIQFLTRQNKIRLRINLAPVKTANLTISSKLLRPAQIVASGKA